MIVLIQALQNMLVLFMKSRSSFYKVFLKISVWLHLQQLKKIQILNNEIIFIPKLKFGKRSPWSECFWKAIKFSSHIFYDLCRRRTEQAVFVFLCKYDRVLF